MIDQFKNKFIEEATDNINDLEEALLLLEKNKEDQDLLERIFRAMHTIKGGGDMFGFSALGNFTHHLETTYDLVRNGKVEIDSKLLDITLVAVDHMKTLLANTKANPQINQKSEEILQKIKVFSNIEILELREQTNENQEHKPKTYFIHFEPDENIFANGTNPLFLIDELYTLGKCKVLAHLNKIPNLEKINPNFCYIYWEILLVTAEDVNAISDVFIFVEDQCQLEIHEVYQGDIFENNEFVKKIAVCEQKDTDIGINQIQQLIKETTIAEEKTNSEQVNTKQNIAKENTISSIRVSATKLDQLMNLVSEMVTTQARLSLFAEKSGNNELQTIAENVQKLSRQLRDNAFDIALVPVETMLTRFQRLVRDLASKMDKKIEFVAEGTDTELDKTIIETLTDPLLHILRNCIDHGIESPNERVKKGKAETGKIILKSFYSGANVHISVQDDGAGIDPEKIRQKAIKNNLISKDANLSKKEILDLTFASGFSTSENVTSISGRGVGMDVVKRKINEIRGEVEIDSEIDKGTTITIKLPLTLSIIDGLLVQISDNKYIIPLSSVDKIYAVEHQKVKKSFNNIITLDGEQFPFYYLREEFDLEENEQQMEEIVLVKYEDNKIGIVVDNVIGEYQAVLKSLGKMYKKQDNISGATILGDGTVALVLDTNKLIKECSSENLEFKKMY